MFQNTRLLVEAAVLNEARQTIAKEIMASQGSARFMAKIPTDTLPVKVLREQVEREFWKSVGVPYGQVKSGNVPEEYQGRRARLRGNAGLDDVLAGQPGAPRRQRTRRHVRRETRLL
jgi:hypothetical protein